MLKTDNWAGARKALCVVLATLAWLALMDVTLGWVLRPGWPWSVKVQSLARYFDYGRSVEGKLQQSLGADGRGTDMVAQAGWLDPSQWHNEPCAVAAADCRLVAVYGQSFALRAARALEQLDQQVQLRLVAGPAAPLAHSYAAYRADVAGSPARVVVIGVLASSLVRSSQLSMTAGTFEYPAPYTYPRFTLDGQTLHEQTPLIQTYPQFVQAWVERGAQWHDFRDQLMAYSPGLDPFAWNGGWSDASVLVRLVRRAWVTSHDSTDAALRNAQGLSPAFAAELPVAQRLLVQAQQLAQQRHQQLIVLLLNDRGYARWLDIGLRSALQSQGLTVLSSSDYFSSLNMNNFELDGHFIPTADQRIARALHQSIAPTLGLGALSPPAPSYTARSHK